MTIKRLAAIIFILLCTTGAWIILGTSLVVRSQSTSRSLGQAVAGVWGPAMTQEHPVIYYNSPGSPNGKHVI